MDKQESIRGTDGKSWGSGQSSDPDGQEGRTSPVEQQVDLGMGSRVLLESLYILESALILGPLSTRMSKSN